MRDGRVAVYLEDKWHDILPPNSIKESWSRFRIELTTKEASIYWNGKLLSKVPSKNMELKALYEHYFSSSGGTPVGDHVLIDDVYFQ